MNGTMLLPVPDHGECAGAMRPSHRRRGAAIISFVAAMLVIGTFVLLLFQMTASASTTAMGHFCSTGAFYAAESGIEMSVRELMQQDDFDGDGSDSGVQFGTISDNGDATDDPALSTGRVYVEHTGTGPAVYQAVGRPTQGGSPSDSYRLGMYRRIVEIEMGS